MHEPQLRRMLQLTRLQHTVPLTVPLSSLAVALPRVAAVDAYLEQLGFSELTSTVRPKYDSSNGVTYARRDGLLKTHPRR